MGVSPTSGPDPHHELMPTAIGLPEAGSAARPPLPVLPMIPALPGAEGGWLILALGALSAFGPLCMDMYLPALPELAGSLGSTAGAASLTLSATILGLSVGQFFVGPASDGWGRRRPLLIGLVVFTLVSAACAVTTSMTLLIALRFVEGFAGAAGIVIGRAVVSDRFAGARAASYFASIAAVNGLAPILAPVIGAQVLRFGSWRLVFWVLTGVGVLFFLLAYFVVAESLPAARRHQGGVRGTVSVVGELVRDPVFVGWAIAGAAVSAAMFGYIAASPFLLQTGFSMSPQWFSACFALNAVGIAGCSQLGRLLLRRRSPRGLLSWGVIQCLVGAVLLAGVLSVRAAVGREWWTLPALLIALFVMVSAVGLALPFSAAIAMDRHRRVAGSASALFGTAQFAIGAVTSALAAPGNSTAGTALAVTAVTASLVALGGLRLASMSLERGR